MFTKILFKTLYCGLFAVCLAACNLPAQTQNASSLTQSDNLLSTAQPGQDFCANALFPVKKGAVWTYTNSSETFGSSTFTTTITDVRANSFTMATQIEQNSPMQEWTCNPDGLLAMSFGSEPSVLDFASEGISGDLSSSNVTGVTIPANVQPGAQWPYKMDVSGHITQTSSNLNADAKGSVSTAFQAIGTESVTVPAGTFQAMKIQAKSTFNITTDFHGLGIPLSFAVDSMFWFAPGVGLVKSYQSSGIGGTNYTAATELQSFNVP
jgi:hypothetical protein